MSPASVTMYSAPPPFRTAALPRFRAVAAVVGILQWYWFGMGPRAAESVDEKKDE